MPGLTHTCGCMQATAHTYRRAHEHRTLPYHCPIVPARRAHRTGANAHASGGAEAMRTQHSGPCARR